MIKVNFQQQKTFVDVPDKKDFAQWLKLVFAKQQAEVTVRLVDEQESAELNQNYRKKSGPTNVLSFYYSKQNQAEVIGDLIFCVPVIQREAQEQQKLPMHHWAHLTIHGALHLLGYDHIQEDEAEEMESLEIELLKKLDIANPYDSKE